MNPPPLRARLQAVGVEQHSSLLQLLVVVCHRFEDPLVWLGARFRVLVGLDQNHEPHRTSSSCLLPFISTSNEAARNRQVRKRLWGKALSVALDPDAGSELRL